MICTLRTYYDFSTTNRYRVRRRWFFWWSLEREMLDFAELYWAPVLTTRDKAEVIAQAVALKLQGYEVENG